VECREKVGIGTLAEFDGSLGKGKTMNCLQKSAAAACCAIAVCLGLGVRYGQTELEGEIQLAFCGTIPLVSIPPDRPRFLGYG
jgi:hypothetical protein